MTICGCWRAAAAHLSHPRLGGFKAWIGRSLAGQLVMIYLVLCFCNVCFSFLFFSSSRQSITVISHSILSDVDSHFLDTCS